MSSLNVPSHPGLTASLDSGATSLDQLWFRLRFGPILGLDQYLQRKYENGKNKDSETLAQDRQIKSAA
jgi:hypothetical protein